MMLFLNQKKKTYKKSRKLGHLIFSHVDLFDASQQFQRKILGIPSCTWPSMGDRMGHSMGEAASSSDKEAQRRRAPG